MQRTSNLYPMSKGKDFQGDMTYAVEMRERYLIPHFYKKYAYQGRYVCIDKSRLSMKLQREYSVDTVMQKDAETSVFVEEKIVRYPGYKYQHFFLETHSYNRNGEMKECWMLYGQADYFLYGYEQERGGLDVYFMPFPELQTWFLANMHRYKESRCNSTYGRLVPIRDVLQAIRVKRFLIPPTEERANVA